MDVHNLKDYLRPCTLQVLSPCAAVSIDMLSRSVQYWLQRANDTDTTVLYTTENAVLLNTKTEETLRRLLMHRHVCFITDEEGVPTGLYASVSQSLLYGSVRDELKRFRVRVLDIPMHLTLGNMIGALQDKYGAIYRCEQYGDRLDTIFFRYSDALQASSGHHTCTWTSLFPDHDTEFELKMLFRLLTEPDNVYEDVSGHLWPRVPDVI